MEPKIREYADALYAKAVSAATSKLAKQHQAHLARMAAAGSMNINGSIRIFAQCVGDIMMARLESFRQAFETTGANPSSEDFNEIWDIIQSVYKKEMKSSAKNIVDLGQRLGFQQVGAGGLEGPLARHHDQVLHEWTIWRARVAAEGFSQTFGIHEVPGRDQLPRKEDLLEDLGKLLVSGQPIGVLFIDLDNFKKVNDTFDHQAGDECLDAAIKIMGSVIVHKGRFYRYASGDEFMAVLPNFEETEAAATAERIRSAIDFANPGGAVKVTASIGVIIATSEAYKSAQDVLTDVDQAMYEAKKIKNYVSIRTGKTSDK